MIGSERDTIINNRVHFTSSDPAALLPGDYYFTPADAGSHTWTNDFVLMTPGNQTISGEIIEATGINGSATVHSHSLTLAMYRTQRSPCPTVACFGKPGCRNRT